MSNKIFTVLTTLVATCILFGFAFPALGNEIARVEATTQSSDFRSVLSADEATRLSELMDSMRTLREIGINLPKGSDDRADIQAIFNKRKKERDDEFGFLNGLGEVDLVLVGNPPPTITQVLTIVVNARRNNQQSVLHPVWERDSEGNIRGHATEAALEINQEQTEPSWVPDPADVEPVAVDYGSERYYFAEPKHCVSEPPHSGFKCVCDSGSAVMGVDACWWALSLPTN